MESHIMTDYPSNVGEIEFTLQAEVLEKILRLCLELTERYNNHDPNFIETVNKIAFQIERWNEGG